MTPVPAEGRGRLSARRLLRAFTYLALGAVPALGLALLGSLMLLNADLRAALLIGGAWSGTLGLMLAAWFPPQPAHPLRSTGTFALLACGELAMAPLSGGALAAGLIGLQPGLLVLIFGPTLLGLHYLGLCLLRFSRARLGTWLGLQVGILLVLTASGLFWWLN